MPVLQSYQSSYKKTDLPHENFTSVSHLSFSGGKIFFKSIFFWNFLSLSGLLYVLGHFKQKKKFFKFFFTNSCSLFVDLLQKQKPVLDWDCSLKTGKKD